MSPGDAHVSARPASRPAIADRFGRTKKKLRLSLTDRCNFRCVYCMPEHPLWRSRNDLLSFEELFRLAKLFVGRFGIEQIRLTGGEPLARREVAQFVAMLARLKSCGLERISLSTNGVLLARHAAALAQAGLDDVNVSLDSLDAPRFARMTGGGDVRDVLNGIVGARLAGLGIKLNCVVIRGLNESDFVPLVWWGKSQQLPVRLIEFMPLDARGFWSTDKVVTEREMVAELGRHFEVNRLPRTREPATYYSLDGTYLVGIIPTVSNPFCFSCDRIRVTADGKLFPCLFSPTGCELQTLLRRGSTDAIANLIRDTIWNKPHGFINRAAAVSNGVSMHQLGG